MRKTVVGGWFLMGALAALAADPKVGATVTFLRDANTESYISNKFFKGRPIAEEMAKNGIDLCWCAGWEGSKVKGGGIEKAVEDLKQFNAIWLLVDHETQCPHPAAETAAALKGYVEAGGGLVICHSTGRYAEAPVDKFWTEVYRTFGLDLLHEAVADKTTSAKEGSRYNLFYTSNVAKHPVTAGVTGLWLPHPILVSTWAVAAANYSPDWTVLVSTGPNGRSYPFDKITNMIDYSREATYREGNVPVVACRTFGKGRIVFLAIHKDNCGWMYNISRWPNYVEDSNWNGKRSDGVKLLENAMKWAAAPSRSDPAFTKSYKPVEPKRPAYFRISDFGQRWLENPVYEKLMPGTNQTAVAGLIGLHSSYSDGESTVAEYVAEAKKLGLSFLVFTDPLAELSPEELEKLRADCAANSSESFYCCPGVEYVDLSGMEWINFADKVSYPETKPVLRDGRYYKIFDGKVMRQPNYYRGVNLYRGALLNNKRIAEIGNFDVNLIWSNHVVPMAYDVDKPLYDNFPEFLQAGANVRRTSTISYTRVRRAADLARAKRASVTRIASVATAKKLCNAEGSEANNVARWGCASAKLGEGVDIVDFKIKRIIGTDTMQCALCVRSPNGMKDIRVVDANKRMLARFLPKGKREFATTFTFEYDAQSYPQIVATDCAGDRAVSTAIWVWSYHAGLQRCNDNANLLSQNPPIVTYPNRDTCMCPPNKGIRGTPRHYHLSETYFWDGFTNAKSRSPSIVCGAGGLRIADAVLADEDKNVMPSSRTSFPLAMPNVVSVIDQVQGEWLVEPTRTEKNGTCTYCSLPPKVAENPWWRIHHRTYQLCDNIDIWWNIVYQENAPDYRGGYTVLEGEVEFLADTTLEVPFSALSIVAKNPAGGMIRQKTPGKFGPGSYYAVIPSEKYWMQVVGLTGCESITVDEKVSDTGVSVSFRAGQKGQKVRKGDVFRYRLALASLLEPPHGDYYPRWFAGMMTGSRFRHDAVKGKVLDVSGFLDLEAEDGEAAVDLGPTWFIQRYPVRVKGLVDNGSAFLTDGGKIVKPLAFMEGLAFAEVPLDERKTWRFMNRYLADNANLRFSYVPAMPGHEKATVQILNNTKKDITSRVRNLVSGETFEVTVPAGSFIVRESAGR